MVTFNAKRLHLARTFAALAFVLLGSTSAPAANVFDEQGCRFVIDLPGGWDLLPQKNDTEYVFKGSGAEMIVVEYLHEEKDVSSLFRKAVSAFRQAGVPDAEPDGKIQDMKVNGHPGRWGLYEGRYTGADKATMKAALGAVVLQDGGVIFVSLPADVSGGTPEKVIKSSFLSLRECRQAVTGADDVRKVDRDAADAGGAEPKHELHALMFPLTLPLELPSGWTAKQLDPEFDKDVVGWMLAGSRGMSVQANCYRGPASSEVNVQKALQDKLASGFLAPRLVTTLDVEREGKHIPVKVYSTAVPGQGKQVAMAVAAAAVQTSRCRLGLFGASPDPARQDLEKDIQSMIRSAR